MVTTALLVLIISVWSPEVTVVVAYNAVHDSCDKTRALRLGESFTFRAFPPNANARTAASGRPNPFRAYAYGVGRYEQPQECTWTFKADEDCLLEFQTKSYQRGNVLCEEQYLLIGDENSEKRICGFANPPKRLNSTGRELFLTHYKRNGGHESVGSVLGGSVRCRKKELPCEPPWSDFSCGPIIVGHCPASGPCTANYTLTTLSDTPMSDTVIATCPDPAHCTVVLWGCGAGSNATCNAPLPTPFFNETTAGQCFAAKIGCPASDPKCRINASFKFEATPSNVNEFTCSFPPFTRCAAAFAFCFIIKP